MTVPVTVANFIRAETDRYFSDVVKEVGLSRFLHYRTPPPIDHQMIIRMNRDTLYSGAVFDLDAGRVTITLPDAGRFMSIQVNSEDHFAVVVDYAPTCLSITRESVGTRYTLVGLRTLIDANHPADIKAANALQDAVTIEQAAVGTFEVPDWDRGGLDFIREHLQALQSRAGVTTERRMGRRGEVDPVFHLLATATGWGLAPPEDAIYQTMYPEKNDGTTPHELTVKDVPVDGFWSITIYGPTGYMFENDQHANSVNSVNATPNEDGSFTIRFGGDPSGAKNYLAITPGWNYSARMYRPHAEVVKGTWNFPLPQPIA